MSRSDRFGNVRYAVDRPPIPFRRRSLLRGGLRLAGLTTATPLLGACAAASRAGFDSSPSDQSTPRVAAGVKGIAYGAAVEAENLNEPAYAAAVARECAVLVPENALKWDRLRPGPGTYAFAAADRIAAFAATHGMALRGHTLVWHRQMPDWFDAAVTPANAESVLVEHVTRVVGRYAGRVRSWDAVNEAVDADGAGAVRPRLGPWPARLPGYVGIAFHAAHAADPAAQLVYNDYGLEADDARTVLKRRFTLDLLKRLLDAGVPVHALGLQAHLTPPNTFTTLPVFLREVEALGLDALVTELDVRDVARGSLAARDRAVADVYARFLGAALAAPALCSTVMTWGLSDRDSWHRRSFPPRPDGSPDRPLPLDDDLRRKAAYHALRAAFVGASPRTTPSGAASS